MEKTDQEIFAEHNITSEGRNFAPVDDTCECAPCLRVKPKASKSASAPVAGFSKADLEAAVQAAYAKGRLEGAVASAGK